MAGNPNSHTFLDRALRPRGTHPIPGRAAETVYIVAKVMSSIYTHEKHDYQSKIEPTPAALVEAGRFNFGTFSDPFHIINPLDAELRQAGRVVPRFLKQLGLKEWQHFILANNRFFINVALFDTKRVNSALVIVYDREEKRIYPYETRFVWRNFQLPNELWDAYVRIRRSRVAITIHNHLYKGYHHVEFVCTPQKGLPALRGDFICHEPLHRVDPLVACFPLGGGRAMYAHKAILRAQGALFLDGQKHAFHSYNSFGIPDIHKGYYPYVMKWISASAGGYTPDRKLIGFNFANNQVEDQHTYNGNALWINGQISLLPPVQFEMSERNPDQPIRITDDEGRVNLTFHPETNRNLNVNLLVLQSRYRSPYGYFTGTIVDQDGHHWPINNLFGMVEDFYLRA